MNGNGRDSDRIRVVHLDPGSVPGSEDLSVERSILAREFEGKQVRLDVLVCDEDEIPGRISDADVVLSGETTVTAETMDAAEPAAIGKYATGVDEIDVEAATERGIPVTNVPTYCDEEVADHAIALALALLRGVPRYEAAVERGEWDWQAALPVRSAAESTFGCFAFGRKARAAADRARALGFDVLAYDAYLDDEEIEDHGARPVSFDGLLEGSDVLSLHAPLTPETEDAFDAEAFAKMREDAILVNTARGRLVDEGALLDALEDGPLAGAGLDVLRNEPPAPDNPLCHRDDVIVTPHTAWYSKGAVDRVRRRGTENVVAAYRGEHCDGLVNPSVLEE